MTKVKRVLKKRVFRSAYIVGNFYNRDLEWAHTHSNPDVTYHNNGNIASIKYWRYHQSETNYRWTSIIEFNPDGPSLQVFYKNGSIKREKYTESFGALHRDNGPALVEYDKNRNVICEEYYISGNFIGKNLHIHDKKVLSEYIQNLEIMK